MQLRSVVVLVVLLMMSLMAVPSQAQSAVQYISPSGSDSNNGLTASNPKASLQAALDVLPTTGGVVYVAPGMYPNTNAVSTDQGVSIIGEGQVGFGWEGGPGPGDPVFESSSGTTLTIGSPSKIGDPGWKISGVWFRNVDGGRSAYGLHAERMRGLTLRDVVFSNYQPSGTALFLDGTSDGWIEWSYLSNVVWANCPHALLLSNATDTNLHGGVFALSAEFSGSVAIEEMGYSDTLRLFGTAINEYDTGVYLHSSEGGNVEAAQIYGLRVENHRNLASSVGVRVSSGYNSISGTFWGVGVGVLLSSTSSQNTVFGCTYPYVLENPVENFGSGNSIAY